MKIVVEEIKQVQNMSEILPKFTHLLKFYGPAGIDRISLLK